MKTKSIIFAIAVTVLIGMTSFTLKDNCSVENRKDSNPIYVSSQSEGGRIPIQSGGKTVGYLEWSKVKYTQFRDGGFMTLYLYNDSDEWIRVSVTGKRASSCYESFKLKPWQEEKEAVFACSDDVSDFSISVYVTD